MYRSTFGYEGVGHIGVYDNMRVCMSVQRCVYVCAVVYVCVRERSVGPLCVCVAAATSEVRWLGSHQSV